MKAAVIGMCALALTAACSSGHGPVATTAVGQTSTPQPSSLSPSPSPSPPLSFYADQYLRIIKPANDALDRLKAMPTTSSDADVSAAAAKMVPVIQQADAALLRVQWPANVAIDIRAMVTSDGALIGDLANLTASNIDQTVRDSGSVNAAANIVRADLGLPPGK